MNVVIYARYSGFGQRENSIEGQLKACYDYAERHGYTVVKEYVDCGKSARPDNRIQFREMINDSNTKSFQAVLVYKLDRFARDSQESVVFKRLLRQNEVAVISVTEQSTEATKRRIFEEILEACDRYQAADMERKTRRSHKTNAEKDLSNEGIREGE